jgi:hypothetical protein
MLVDFILAVCVGAVIVGITYPMYYFMRKIFAAHEDYNFSHGIKSNIAYSPLAQEDTRDAAVKRSVRDQIDRQWQAMNARALKCHDPKCLDPWTCTKNPCFVYEPDKIAWMATVERAKTKGVLREE